MPTFVEPMLAKLAVDVPKDDERWAFEIKWDGVRAICRCEDHELTLTTRNGIDVTATYPELHGIVAALGGRSAMLDGEIVALDRDGRSSFRALQGRMHLADDVQVKRRARQAPVSYIIFDLLWLDGRSLMKLPYLKRRAQLKSLRLHGDRWRVPSHHVGDGAALLAASKERDLEGLIAKRIDSPYVPGLRQGAWLKVKNVHRQELVIGGWREGKGARERRIGALELGVHDEQGDLLYAGRVGTGFSEAELDRLSDLLKPLARERSPFQGAQPAKGARFVAPELVCEVRFGEWTADGRLRHPSYQGLRTDKLAAEVVREQPTAPHGAA